MQVLAPQNLLLIEMGLILAMTIVGGLGTLTGPIIGAILLVVMWEIMRDVSPYAHMLLFATLVIVVMKFFRARHLRPHLGSAEGEGTDFPSAAVHGGVDPPVATHFYPITRSPHRSRGIQAASACGLSSPPVRLNHPSNRS